MTYGRNPLGGALPLGSNGRTNVPLPKSTVVKVQPAPVPVRQSIAGDSGDLTAQDAIDTSDVSELDSESTDGAREEPSGNGIWSKLVGNSPQPGDKDVDIIEGDPETADAIINGGGEDADINDDTIYGSDDSNGEMSDEELDMIIEGDDEEMDKTIYGINDGDDGTNEMSDEESDRIIYGEPDEPEVRKVKKSVYRVSGSKQRAVPSVNTGMGRVQ